MIIYPLLSSIWKEKHVTLIQENSISTYKIFYSRFKPMVSLSVLHTNKIIK